MYLPRNATVAERPGTREPIVPTRTQEEAAAAAVVVEVAERGKETTTKEIATVVVSRAINKPNVGRSTLSLGLTKAEPALKFWCQWLKVSTKNIYGYLQILIS